ncbi:MAG: Fur family transcriptional regulator [Sodaliphilus sp.]|nr:Fur family transcriptional regulator [Sodaliphilus sp.]
MTATEQLIEHNIRPSVQRVAIMQYLLDHRTHPTADDIYTELVKTMPTLSRTTVYNTLQLLVTNQAVLGLTIDQHNMHFDGYTHPHAHFLCRSCGKIFDVEVNSHLREHLFTSDKFAIEKVELNYMGLCPDCRIRETNNDN